jgi:acyl-CoA reductase-like NAD-dependent aldehyde dehydrogenase
LLFDQSAVLFTGSTEVGQWRAVGSGEPQHAHHAGVGRQSPCVVDDPAAVRRWTMPRLKSPISPQWWQTRIAPDYVMPPRGITEVALAAF